MHIHDRDDFGSFAAPTKMKAPLLGGGPSLGGGATFCSFDCPQDFIRASWIELCERAFTRDSNTLALETASNSDTACKAFLDTLAASGVVTKPECVSQDENIYYIFVI